MPARAISAVSEAETERKSPVVNPDSVQIDVAGFVTRSLVVRMPEGTIADDLKEPSIWANVQAMPPKALRKHDRLYMVAFDESWVAEASVADADSTKAVLAKPRLTTFPERYEKLFEDDKYRVKWFGNGYAVERKSDSKRVSDIVANAALATRDLANLYPRTV